MADLLPFNYENGESNWAQRLLDPSGTEMAFNAQQAQTARDFEAQEAQKNRDWQENLANTAYQRAVADMKAAGLNPALLYGSASPSATPSGAVGRSSSASVGGGASSRSFMGLLSSLLTFGASAMRVGSAQAVQNMKNSAQAMNAVKEVSHFDKWGQRVGTTIYKR